MNCIEAIWEKYDDDASGYLDKDECFKFIMESFRGFSVEATGITINTEESDDDE